MQVDKVNQSFKKEFGGPPEKIVFAPGRVNLIGEHTDYSEGFVMPIAINKGIFLGIRKNDYKNKIRAYSIDFDQKREIKFEQIQKTKTGWFNYPIGVVKELIKENYTFGGFDLCFTGNLPQGAGLSSSAALEIATGYAIQKVFDIEIEAVKLARICQNAEHNTVGVNCGIMDQFISRLGKKDHALFIDTRSFDYEQIPLNLTTAKIIITNSNVPHKLSNSQYNARVSECEEAVRLLDPKSKEKKFLRDFSLEDFREKEKNLPKSVRKRALHVISENQRVILAKKYLKKHKLEKFGKLMNESHCSLKDHFEVSSKELDFLVNLAQEIDGVYGSRMTGAGFGGCTVTLIEEKSIEKYKQNLVLYNKKFGYEPEVYKTTAENGVRIINP